MNEYLVTYYLYTHIPNATNLPAMEQRVRAVLRVAIEDLRAVKHQGGAE